MSSMPDADTWRLMDKDEGSQYYGKEAVFDFTIIGTLDLRSAVKKYIWINYQFTQRSPRGLRESLRRITIVDKYMIVAGYSLKTLDHDGVEGLRSFLAMYISPSTGRKITFSYQRNCFSELRSLIRWCKAYEPKLVSESSIFTGNEYRQNYRKLKIDYIPDDMMLEIEKALEREDNVYLRAGLIIMKETGIRIGDLLLLRRDCLQKHPINGTMLQWFDHKNRVSRKPLPINPQCVCAVEMLLRISEPLVMMARESERNNLFLYKPRIGTNTDPVITVGKQVFTKWCATFCEHHDIRDSAGNPYRITAHKFRRTLGTDMFSNGTNIKVIQEVLGHASPTTTKMYYADVKDSSNEKMFLKLGILGSLHETIASGGFDQETSEYLRENMNGSARMVDGYCTLPSENGVPCARLMSRWKCYQCSRFVTTVNDLEAHRSELKNLENILQNNIYGDHYAAHLIPSILALREIILRLEEIDNGHC